MNSSLKKALVASLLAVGGSVAAIGQTGTGGYDYDPHCIDPNNTAPYSTDFISYYMETPLWSGGLGISGTVTWKFCINNGGSVAVPGRFAMAPGPTGSIQDDLRIASGKYDVVADNYEDFQFGQNRGVDPEDLFQSPDGTPWGAQSGSGWSFARVYEVAGTTKTNFLFGSTGFDQAFQGASNRYMFAEQTSNNAVTRLVMDILGDTARFSWRLTNASANTMSLGLWLGQWINPVGGYTGQNPAFNHGESLGWLNSGNVYQPYVQVPGLKPLEVDARFNRATDPTNFPAYCNFSGGTFKQGPNNTIVQDLSPQVSGGLQVVNAPYQNVMDENQNSDQTPVDEFDIGHVSFLMSGIGYQTNPTFNDVEFADAFFNAGCCFVQKWQPTTVAAGQFRDIVSYYRSTWGDSNYANGYTGVVDSPKVISSNTSGAGGLDPNPYTLRVIVDNTGGFGQVYKSVNMNNVAVTLKLPQGMHAVGNPAQTTITQYISNVPFRATASTDFKVQVENTVVGLVPYSVVIQPSPGASKTITGIINVAATPVIPILNGANLVSLPWTFSDTSWEGVLAQLGAPVSGYQTYTWDSAQQSYVLQTGPQRGVGTWIVSNEPSQVVNLAGSPTQPTDEILPASGAPNIQLQAGWNLVGNPYNYSFPLGQLVGVPQGTSTAQTFSQLVAQNIFDGSFAYYDPSNQSYSFIQNATDDLLPNYGYWVFCNTPITLSFPPLYDLFIRTAKPAVNQNQVFNHYKFQIAAQTAKSRDMNTFVGLDSNSKPTLLSAKKAPISPYNYAIRGFATSQNVVPALTQGSGVTNSKTGQNARSGASGEFSQMIHSTLGKQVFNYSVYSASSGPVNLTWPNLASLPKNLGITILDRATNRSINPRSTSGYAFTGNQNGIKTFQVTITPLATVRQAIGSVSTPIKATGGTKQMNISFTTATGGEATINVYQNGKQVGTIAQNMAIVAGTNSVTWSMHLINGTAITSGTYVLQISALGEGGDTATKLVTLSL